MGDEKRNCKECGEGFTPKGKNQYGVQKFCSKECKNKFHSKYENRKKGSKKKYTTAYTTASGEYTTASNNKKRSLKQEVSNIQQHLYPVKNGSSIIKKVEKIHEDLVNYMNILKLDTYPEEVRNYCIYIMKESNRFLQNQLKKEKDRGVIIVKTE